MKKTFLTIVTALISVFVFGQGEDFKITLLRAAPGGLADLIEELTEKDDGSAHLLRHSQGDQWDLMLIEEDLANSPAYGSEFYDLVAWQEEAFVQLDGNPDFDAYFDNNSFFHIEMFVSLAGKQKELLKERQMENEYLEETGRKPNLILVRTLGFKYDIMTIGAYSSLLEYAEGGNQPAEVQEKAALKAGFKSASDIGFYLRSLIGEHHDTLANKVF